MRSIGKILEGKGTYGYLRDTKLLDDTAWTVVSDRVVCRVFEDVWNAGEYVTVGVRQ